MILTPSAAAGLSDGLAPCCVYRSSNLVGWQGGVSVTRGVGCEVWGAC